jgi:uncharacterized protein YoaH (UPF0181 family)
MTALTELEAQELLEDIQRLANEGSTSGDDIREGTQGLRQSLDELLKSCGATPGNKLAQGWWEKVAERERVAVRLRSMQRALQSVTREKD